MPPCIKTETLQKMKAKFFLALLVCFSPFVFSAKVIAQVTTVKGPSDNTTTPPASASAVAQVLGTGNVISLRIGSTSTATDIRYQWYKLDNTGTKQLVQDGTDGTFHETAAGAGYYTYQLVMSNSNQCTSDISDPFKVYVLPALSPTIAASSGTICSNGTSASTLTANPGNSNFSYQYQWALNGTNISGATGATYTLTSSTSGSNTYSVRVAFVLSPSTTATATQTINAIAVPTKPAISVGQ